MASDESIAASGSKVYRDGDHLVAALEGARFPDRCVVTNESTANRFRYREKITPGMASDMARYAESAWKGGALALGAAGAAPIGLVGAAAILATMKTVVLEIGLSADLAARFRRRKARALGLVFGGLLGAFVLPFVITPIASAVVPTMSDESIALYIMIPIAVVSFAIAMGGLLYFAIAVRQPIQIRTTDGRFVWFAGAHPKFLAALPAFPRTPAA
jgi:hypothetical protein